MNDWPFFRSSRGYVIGLLLLMTLSQVGCQSIGALATIFADDPATPPPIQLCQGRRDKKKLLVLTWAGDTSILGYDAIDQELTANLTNELAQGDQRFEMVPERTIREWQDLNPGWADVSLQEIGEHFDVDYVIFSEINEFNHNTTKNHLLLQGTASVNFTIQDVNKGTRLTQKVHDTTFPANRAVSLSEVSSEDAFRQMFLQRIARELSWNLIPHPVHAEFSEF